MLGLAGLGGYRIVPGQVIARRGVPGLEEAAQIDVGTADGVRRNMTVLNDAGPGRPGGPGRPEHSATVALLTDPATGGRARLEGGNEIGVVNGLGHGMGDTLVRFRLFDSTVSLTARPAHRQLRLARRRAVRGGGADRRDRAGGAHAR